MKKFEKVPDSFIENLMHDIARNRKKILDDFLKAYVAEKISKDPNFHISDLELIEDRNAYPATTVYRFRTKSHKTDMNE